MSLRRLTLLCVGAAALVLWLHLQFPAPQIVRQQHRLVDLRINREIDADIGRNF